MNTMRKDCAWQELAKLVTDSFTTKTNAMAKKKTAYPKKSPPPPPPPPPIKYFWFETDFDATGSSDPFGRGRPFIDQFYRGYLCRFNQEIPHHDYNLAETEWHIYTPGIHHGKFFVDKPVIIGATTT